MIPAITLLTSSFTGPVIAGGSESGSRRAVDAVASPFAESIQRQQYADAGAADTSGSSGDQPGISRPVQNEMDGQEQIGLWLQQAASPTTVIAVGAIDSSRLAAGSLPPEIEHDADQASSDSAGVSGAAAPLPEQHIFGGEGAIAAQAPDAVIPPAMTEGQAVAARQGQSLAAGERLPVAAGMLPPSSGEDIDQLEDGLAVEGAATVAMTAGYDMESHAPVGVAGGQEHSAGAGDLQVRPVSTAMEPESGIMHRMPTPARPQSGNPGQPVARLADIPVPVTADGSDITVPEAGGQVPRARPKDVQATPDSTAVASTLDDSTKRVGLANMLPPDLGGLVETNTRHHEPNVGLSAVPGGGVPGSVSQGNGSVVATPQPPERALELASSETPARLTEQVRLLLSRDQHQLEIKLHPSELGHLHIKLQVHQDQAQVHFVVQNPQAREVLEQALPRLREMLADSGIQLGQAGVEQQRQQGQPGNGHAHRTSHPLPDRGVGIDPGDRDVSLAASLSLPLAGGAGCVDFFA